MCAGGSSVPIAGGCFFEKRSSGFPASPRSTLSSPACSFCCSPTVTLWSCPRHSRPSSLSDSPPSPHPSTKTVCCGSIRANLSNSAFPPLNKSILTNLNKFQAHKNHSKLLLMQTDRQDPPWPSSGSAFLHLWST